MFLIYVCLCVQTLTNAAVQSMCVREMQTASTVQAAISVNVLMGIDSHLTGPALVSCHHHHYRQYHCLVGCA